MASLLPARQAPAESGQPSRVLIVDDSAVTRAVLSRLIDASDRWTVTCAVATAEAALAFLGQGSVEVILLDIHLPGASGLAALPDLVAVSAGAKVVALSSIAAASEQALTLGAAAALTKPGPGDGISRFGGELLDVLDRTIGRALPRPVPGRDLSPVRLALPAPTPAPTPAAGWLALPAPVAERPQAAIDFDVVAIGASTGGIHALGAMLRDLPAACRLPILVTQHLPASFMPYFAAQLAVIARRPCDVATDRMRVRPGRLIVAPGDAHLHCVPLGDGGTAIRLSRSPAASGCLPSVDPMLASLAAIHGGRLLAVMLSGMGRDGADGARAARAAGACIVVQDCESSVVWGMPGAVVAAGLADAVLPPGRIGSLIAAGRRP